MSVSPSAWNNLDPTGQRFMKFDIKLFFPKSAETFGNSLNSDKNNGYFTCMSIYTFKIVSRTTIVRTRIISDKI